MALMAIPLPATVLRVPISRHYSRPSRLHIPHKLSIGNARTWSYHRCSAHFDEFRMLAQDFMDNARSSLELVPTLEVVRGSLSAFAEKGLIYVRDIDTFSVSAEFIEWVGKLKVLAALISSQVAKFVEDPKEFNAMIGYLNSVVQTYSGNVTADPVPVASTALATVAGSAVLGAITNHKSTVEGQVLPLRYDPVAIAAYFEKRPFVVASRLLELAVDCSSLAASLAMDNASGKLKENEKKRARQSVNLITKLGPTFIKLGQALSIRPDILPVAYLEELEKLQDKVPPFSNETASILIAEGLGRPLEEVLSEISVEPVAAASLGQVYKGTLRETEEVVAVKVQRPGVLETISRDLFLLRNAAEALQALPFIHSNLVALVDNLAYRFFNEIDYVQEARNAEKFAENMRPLHNIKVPKVFMQYTSRKVLITEWVDGERLSESREGDLLYLVNAALNCFLVQLLESGFLHADPHPGNLLRTTDGCLCILDYGLMTEVTEEQRYTFFEYISHLVREDYEKVADDLVRLGFVPPELVDPGKTAEVVPLLSRVLGQLIQGGGARKVNVQQVTEDLAKISEDYVFVIPPYFALILKVFSILEGLGLEADPDYAILDGCYPYLAKRLLTDDSPRTHATLKYYLYGESNRLDLDKVEEMFNGFEEFQKLTMRPGNSGGGQTLSLSDPASKDAIFLLFSPNGSFLQELLLTELVCTVDALSRAALAELWSFVSQTFIPFPSAAHSAPRSWPIFLPSFFLGNSRIASLSEDDEYYLKAVKRLWRFVEPRFKQESFSSGIFELVQGILPLMPELFPGINVTAQRFVLMLLQRQALRLADDLDGQKSVVTWEKDPLAFARQRTSGQGQLPVPYSSRK